MLIAYAKIHARYCQKVGSGKDQRQDTNVFIQNLESWQEVRAEIDKIPMA